MITVYAAKRYVQNKKHQRPVSVSVKIVNRSSISLAILGQKQELWMSDGSAVPGRTAKFSIAPGATRKVVFTFLVPEGKKPRTAVIDITGKQTDFKLKF